MMEPAVVTQVLVLDVDHAQLLEEEFPHGAVAEHVLVHGLHHRDALPPHLLDEGVEGDVGGVCRS